ncbi:hypothetical protein P7D22_20375 [Lichenihabitans sp. Uapishka_5]|uniref:hypothetical protein n=1 Tax=Lichenihabitans sp. Uapishka_5 TaxID=3037302 RepID=UPI0029E8135D|nr:hypothetical protein [Lichenihabitans sp. Uapishka_5]MDX7953525.1 hypothetical protein [Lichenihabitans sp. Uapishka_5]
MQITSRTLTALSADVFSFSSTFQNYAESAFSAARLLPVLSKPRLVDSWGSWKNDLKRVGDHEKNLVNGLDHFKQAGHLAFWIRRMSPVVEATDSLANPQDAPGYAPDRFETAFRKILFAYSNEYLAFDLGYQIVNFYEKSRTDRVSAYRKPEIDSDYYETMCHFLKFKNVSPHALHLIYRSLFS